MRTILHSDLNNFYASVECLERPTLRGKSVAVVGDASSRHGIILAKNERAKAFGVKTGEAIWQAKKKCPDLLTVGADLPKYVRYSERVKEIYSRFTDLIEPFGIDECWLDVTHSKMFGDGEEIAKKISNAIKTEIGLTVSIGVSFNKIYAKLASDMKKPDAITVVTKENYREKIYPLPVRDLLFVGKSTEKKLLDMNIKTIGQLAEADLNFLTMKLGKWGTYLKIFASGRDSSPVRREDESREIKSIGNSMTAMEDITNFEGAKRLIWLLAESVTSRLKDSKMGRVCTVKLGCRDNTLYSFSSQVTLSRPTDLCEDIAGAACEMIKSYDFKVPLRSLSVAVTNFTANEQMTIEELEDAARYDKKRRAEGAAEQIRSKYGFNAIVRGVIYEDGALYRTDVKGSHTVHPEGFTVGNQPPPSDDDDS